MEIAIDGLGAPLHQGAIRYYREIGLDIRRACCSQKPRMAPAIKQVRPYEFTLAALDSFSVRAFPYLLQRVCEHLRTLAVGDPFRRIWRNLHVHGQ